MRDEVERENDDEKEPNESGTENLSEIARRMIFEADIDEHFFELTLYLEKWIQKFPPEYFAHGALIFKIENRQLAGQFYPSKEIDTSEIIKFLSKYW